MRAQSQVSHDPDIRLFIHSCVYALAYVCTYVERLPTHMYIHFAHGLACTYVCTYMLTWTCVFFQICIVSFKWKHISLVFGDLLRCWCRKPSGDLDCLHLSLIYICTYVIVLYMKAHTVCIRMYIHSYVRTS